MTMIETAVSAEQLRQQGMARVRANELEASLPLFDQALSLSADDELRELITINKAGALVSMEQGGTEVDALPRIVLRRRSERNVCLAAYTLQRKFTRSRDFRKSYSYGRIALEAADAIDEPLWRVAVLTDMGNVCVYDSRPADAIVYYEQALDALDALGREDLLSRSFLLQNLGYCRILQDETLNGIETIERAMAMMQAAGADGYIAESLIDLCFGYLELGELDKAKACGDRGLELATEVRQVRNAHYLLGELAYKAGDTASAELHFEHLARYYPDFPHLKDLLLAIDLRGMVNLKL